MRKGWRFLVPLLLGLAAAPPALAAGCTLGKLAELPVTMQGLVPTVPAKLGSVDVKLEVDSGAFFSLLTPQAAARAGLHVGATPYGLDYITGLGGDEHAGLATANGFSLAGHTFKRADFLVAAPQIGYGNEVDGLLGNNLLSFADVEFDLANGEIRLFKPIGCRAPTNFAYWAPGAGEAADITPAAPPQNKIIVYIKVNGHPMKAVLDSGVARSFITKQAARAAGVSVDEPGVKPAGMAGGIGPRRFRTWIARFDSFAVGDEEVKNAMLRIADADMGEADMQMMIGADFLLSHRVYVANSQHKLYFTYIGGPVFNLDQAAAGDQAGAQTTAAAAPAPAISGAATDQPVDADGFARRAAASDARHEYAAAIADYTRAIALQPTAEHDYYERARAHWQNQEARPALDDLSAALKLQPDDEAALMARGDLRLQMKDEAGADADFEAAAKIKPNDRFAIAIDYQRERLFEKAVGEIGRWIAEHPKDPTLDAALNDRCWARALWGKELSEALADCTAAIQLAPKVASFHDSRGLVLLRLGQYQASIGDYDYALKVNPRIPWSLYGRGVDKLRLGRKAEGEADLAAAAALDPRLAETAKGYGVTP